MAITNSDNIKSWSGVSQEDLESFGEGDFARTQMLNPAIFTLLGDIKGKKVLDAGCGNGYLARMLAKMGAQVVGIEPGETMFKYAIDKENKEKLGITYHKIDLSTLNEFNQRFDVVIANMVFMDIPDYKTAIINCIRSLKIDGILIYSLLHPCFPGFEKEWQEMKHVKICDYFNERNVEAKYGHVFYRPLQNYINLMNEYGCVTERIIEPQLSKEFAENNPELSRSFHVPQFIVIKAKRIK